MLVVSFVVLPGQWRAWVELLIANQGKGGTWAAIPIPLVVRAPIGVLLVIWGAPRNQRWTVPVCAMLALPALWYGSLSMLLAVIPLTTPERAGARLGAGPRLVRARAGGGVAAVAALACPGARSRGGARRAPRSRLSCRTVGVLARRSRTGLDRGPDAAGAVAAMNRDAWRPVAATGSMTAVHVAAPLSGGRAPRA